MYMEMELVTPNWEPACASLGGVDHAVTALVHQAPGELVVLTLVNVAMELGAIMRQVSVLYYHAFPHICIPRSLVEVYTTIIFQFL